MKVYEPTGRAREYSPLALNYLTGCTHGCKYCYVPAMNSRFNSSYCHKEFVSNVNYTEIEKSIMKLSNKNKQILLSFTTDPYQEKESGETREVIKLLTKYNCHFSILTKNPEKFNRDIDLVSGYPYFKIGSTLTFLNDNDSLEWEPGAPTSYKRLFALKNIAKQNIKTWISFEPVIKPDDSLQFLRLASSFVDHVKIGKINNYQGLDKNIDWYSFLKEAVNICKTKNIKFYIKKDLAEFKKDIFLSSENIDMDYLNV